MGLFQNALVTYNNNVSLAGHYAEGKEPLAPVGYIISKADIRITIDCAGNYVTSGKIPKGEEKILIPVTEASAGRSGTTLAPHPLNDQIKYLAAYDSKSTLAQREYLMQLDQWNQSGFGSDKTKAVWSYISKNAILNDLSADGNIKLVEGVPENEKIMIAWTVIDSEDGSDPRADRDLKLMEQFTRYYLLKTGNKKTGIDAVTGDMGPVALQHLKGVFSLNGNAKLISSNDKQNFTYRGRFLTPDDAVTIGYESSQKSHNALKWLLANQGVVIGKRAYLCWSPDNDKIPQPEEPIYSGLFGKEFMQETSTLPEYKELLRKALNSYKTGIRNQLSSRAVIACFDATTTGRLAITYYSELSTLDFLERLEKWDEHCCWYLRKENILAPSLQDIALYTFGTERNRDGNGKLDLDDSIYRSTVERLLYCRIGRNLYPADMERKLVENASHLNLYGKFTRYSILGITCAVIRKYRYDHYKEDFEMALEKGRQDRSYQFGRLLAIFEKIETDTYGEDESGREPNAMRLQSVYCNQPLHYSFELEKQMERAYFPRLSSGSQIFYKNLMGEIMDKIHSLPESEWNRPLGDTYLLGYYLQRKELYSKRKAES